MDSNEPGRKFDLKGFGAFGVIWATVAAIAGGAVLGFFADRLFRTPPFFMIAFMLLGIMAGFVKGYKTIMKDFDKK